MTVARLGLIAAGIVSICAAASGSRPGVDAAHWHAEAEQLGAVHQKDASRAAIDKYQLALVAWERVGAYGSCASAAQGQGAIYRQLGLLQQSLNRYSVALSQAVRTGDPLLESEIRSELGEAEALVADEEQGFDRARAQCERGLQLARASASDRAEGKAFICLGEVAYHRFRLDEALEAYEKAERLAEKLGDSRGRAQALLYQGYVHSDLSRFEEARACYEGAKATGVWLDDERARALVLVAEAKLLLRIGNYQEALSRFSEALVLLQPTGDLVWQGAALTGIGEVYLSLADTPAAMKHWEQGLDLLVSAGLKQVAVDVLTYIGATYLASGDDRHALTSFERALELADELGIARWRANALRFMGVVYLFRRQPEQALPLLERSLQVLQVAYDPRFEAQTRADLGEVHLLQGQPDLARPSFHAALALSHASVDRVTQARGLFGLARASERLGDLRAARTEVERALSVVESLRTATEDRELRASYFASVYRYHDFHMDTLMRLDSAGQGPGLSAVALEASEMSRARGLLDGLKEAGVDVRRGVDPALLRRERELERAFGEWAERQRELAAARHPARALEAPALEYRDLEQRYGQVQAEIRSESPGYAALAHTKALSVGEIGRQVLDADSVLLEYALGEERSYLWFVSPSGHLSYELPARDEIERAARQAYGFLTSRLVATGDMRARARQTQEADAAYWRQARLLSDMLLGPVANEIRGKRILVVADGVLQYLPFGALPQPGNGDRPTPMVAEHVIVNVPSATVLALARQQYRRRAVPPRTLGVVADPVLDPEDPRLTTVLGATGSAARANRREGYPRLIATRQEADAILAWVPPEMALRAIGFEASRAMVMNPQLGQYKIVHFATHSVLNNDNPGQSGIVLSMFNERGAAQDGFLRLRDIFALKLPAELVVLSACDTALGRQVRGEGLVGTVRGFMYAGAKRVIASLWKVDDEATAELMSLFYREVLENGKSPADALREAQLALRRDRRWGAPFYWASFVLQGEPR